MPSRAANGEDEMGTYKQRSAALIAVGVMLVTLFVGASPARATTSAPASWAPVTPAARSDAADGL